MSIIETIEELEQCDKNNCKFFTFCCVHLAKVIYCYDGDTIHCIFKHNDVYQKFRIRMNGYDCCEMKPSKKIESKIRAELIVKAKEAKARLEELILGKNVYLFCDGLDKYGRILGTVRFVNDVESVSVNQMMINEGYGYVYEGGTKRDVAEQLEMRS